MTDQFQQPRSPAARVEMPWPEISTDEQRLPLCEERLCYEFQDKALLRSALTHASGADHRLASNERLEFLGDAILGAVVCEVLFQHYPQYLEGELTRIKSAVVSRQTCARISAKLGLNELLIVGKGVTNTPTIPPSILADVFESLIAAIYLDGGIGPVQDFIKRHLLPEIDATVTNDYDENFKSSLQQYSQKLYGKPPDYELIEEQGPDHAKNFCIVAVVGEHHFTAAWGQNKKEAEQLAARNALTELNQVKIELNDDDTNHNDDTNHDDMDKD